MNCKPLNYTGPFKDVIPGYIDFKRGLGYDYGYVDQYRLHEIDVFFKNHGVVDVAISEELFDAWNTLRENETEANLRRRANKLIAFAKYLKSRGYTDIFMGELPCRYQRSQPNPHVFTQAEIARIFAVAKAKAEDNSNSADYSTFVAMLSLYYCCGLRKTEVQNLLMRDIDFGSGVIRIMNSKNHVSRLVVASESLHGALAQYCNLFCIGRSDDDRIFKSGRSALFSNEKIYRIYHEILSDAGIQPRENGRLPRLHDLRHTFCVHALEAMSKKGFDLYVALPLLVKYLGHNCISETEYYLRLVSENFNAITEKSRAYAPTLFPKAGDVDE
jgi:integrase